MVMTTPPASVTLEADHEIRPASGSGKSRSPTVRPYTLLCIYKSSRQTGNLPGGM